MGQDAMLLMRHPRARPSRSDWRIGLPYGELGVTCRVALPMEVHLSSVPHAKVPQTRILALRIEGGNPGHLTVSMGEMSTVVGRDGAFTLRSGGGGPAGAWREMLVGRVEGRRLLVSIYQCHIVGERPGAGPLTCKILFRGTNWSRF